MQEFNSENLLVDVTWNTILGMKPLSCFIDSSQKKDLVHRSPTTFYPVVAAIYHYVARTSLLTGNLLCICFDKKENFVSITMH